MRLCNTKKRFFAAANGVTGLMQAALFASINPTGLVGIFPFQRASSMPCLSSAKNDVKRLSNLALDGYASLACNG
jgi:hypothetical protein